MKHLTANRALTNLTCLALLIGCLWSPLHAGGGPEQLALVVNTDSWASKAVANAYIAGRNIPASNVVHLSGITSFERVDADSFRENILLPAVRALEERGVASQIDYLIYAPDFPTHIMLQRDVGDRKLPAVLTPGGSINGMTYLYAMVLQKNISYMGLKTNLYARMPLPKAGDPTAWEREDTQRLMAARVALDRGDQQETAAQLLAQVEAQHKDNHEVLYLRARLAMQQGDQGEAYKSLRRAVDQGFDNASRLLEENDFRRIRGRTFDAIVAQAEQHPIELMPTSGFSSRLTWGTDGMPAPADRGMRYLLSTVLATTSGRGLSVEEAIANLQRSIASDSTYPTGTIYLADNNDVRARTRRWAFVNTVRMLKEEGVNAEVISDALPRSAQDVAGASLGTPTIDWTRTGSTIMPGAIVEHLTSFGGALEDREGQTALTELLRHGAAGASGTVTEPYAIQAKFPMPFVHVHYVRGSSLAEAFYQSVAAPYQLLIVGDPLASPWAIRPLFYVTRMVNADSLSGTVNVSVHADPDSRIAPRQVIVFLDGRAVASQAFGATSAQVPLDTTALPDGPASLSVVALGNAATVPQGRYDSEVVINNHNLQITSDLLPPVQPLEGEFTIRASLAGAARLVLTHQGRVLAEHAGTEATWTIPAAVLGMGESYVRVEAWMTQRPRPEPVDDPPGVRRVNLPDVVGSRLPVNVLGPANQLAAISEPPAVDTLAPGLRLDLDDQGPRVIESLRPHNWVATAGIPRDTPFTLSGYVLIDDDHTHQIQFRSNRPIEFQFSGRTVYHGRERDWIYLPLRLEKGWHELKIRVQGPGETRLNVHFGSRGTQNLAGPRFMHVRLPAGEGSSETTP